MIQRLLRLMAVAALSLPAPARGSDWELDVSQNTPRQAALRSALCPGLGQWRNEERSKAWVVGFMTWGAVGGSLYLWRKSNNTHAEYLGSGGTDQELYDAHQRQRDQALITAGVGLAAYVYGILDAYAAARRGVYGVSASRIKLDLEEDGAILAYQRRF